MKPLRRHLLLLPLVVAAAACSAQPSISVVVTAARAPGDNCDFSDPTKYVEGGAVDMSVFGAASNYFQVFSWESQLQQISTTVNGDVIASSQANTFVANYAQLTYILGSGTTCSTATPCPAGSFCSAGFCAQSLAPGIINMSATITAGATPDKNSVGVELLTGDAAAAANAVVVPGTSTTLLVTFQIAGNLVSGASSMTNPITYPLTLFTCAPAAAGGGCAAPNSDLTCPTNYHSQTTSCNVPGRDIPYCVHD